MSAGSRAWAGTLGRLAASPWMVLLAIAAGIAVGQAAPGLAGPLEYASEFYIELLKMVVLPFMVAAVIFSLRKLVDGGGQFAVLPRVAAVFAGSFLAAAAAGLLAGLLLAPGSHLPTATLVSMGRLAGSEALGGRHDTFALLARPDPALSQGAGELIKALIPVNVFASLAQGDTLKVMAFSLCFGLAAGGGRDRSRSLTAVLETVYRACLLLTQWFNRLLPLALFAIVASQTARTGLEPLRAMVKFLLALLLGSLGLLALSLLALRLASRRPLLEVLRSQREPLLMAVATRTSSACMPAMTASLAGPLGFPRSRIELLVPLGISLLRTGQTFYYVVATLFLAQLYDVRLGAGGLAVVAAGAVLTGFASAGTSGIVAMSLTGLLCAHLRLPFDAVMALFVAVDPVCDLLRTVVGVVGNEAFAALASGREA